MRVLVVVPLVLALAGCGSAGTATVTVVRTAASSQECSRLGDSGFVLCNDFGPRSTSVFYAGRKGRRRALPVERPTQVGHWVTAFVSPDRRMLLAQWSAECEVPFAFFVPSGGGKPRVVTGEGDLSRAPESVAHGWTSDGRAIVELLRGPCGGSGAKRPGLYLVSVSGAMTPL